MAITAITVIAILISACLFYAYIRSGRTYSDLPKRAKGIDSTIDRVGILQQESENRTSAIKRANEETRLGLDRASVIADEDSRRIAGAKELLERVQDRITEADGVHATNNKDKEY